MQCHSAVSSEGLISCPGCEKLKITLNVLNVIAVITGTRYFISPVYQRGAKSSVQSSRDIHKGRSRLNYTHVRFCKQLETAPVGHICPIYVGHVNIVVDFFTRKHKKRSTWWSCEAVQVLRYNGFWLIYDRG